MAVVIAPAKRRDVHPLALTNHREQHVHTMGACSINLHAASRTRSRLGRRAVTAAHH